MSQNECDRSSEIVLMGAASPEASAHLQNCGSCREQMRIQTAMLRLAEASFAQSRMPDARVVLVRSRILEKRRVAAEIARPLRAFQTIAYAIVGGCWLLFALMQWSPLMSWLGGLELNRGTGLDASTSLPLSFFWMLAVLSIMTMMTMLHGMWTEESGVHG